MLLTYAPKFYGEPRLPAVMFALALGSLIRGSEQIISDYAMIKLGLRK
jgi:hypothetical protein